MRREKIIPRKRGGRVEGRRRRRFPHEVSSARARARAEGKSRRRNYQNENPAGNRERVGNKEDQKNSLVRPGHSHSLTWQPPRLVFSPLLSSPLLGGGGGLLARPIARRNKIWMSNEPLPARRCRLTFRNQNARRGVEEEGGG